MAILRAKDISKMNEKEIEEKIKDLKMELVKNKVSASKGGKLKIREIKRTIARLHTISRLKQTSLKKESLNKENKKSAKK
jgi:large subunit ribosomal protein L29